jgi:hypothetical protein
VAKSKAEQNKASEAQGSAAADLAQADELGVGSGDERGFTEVGVPMLDGAPTERQGAEDALGEGPKRGDYAGRVGANHFESRPIPGGGQVVENDDGGFDNSPRSEIVAQDPRVEEIGDVAGRKGGVDSTKDPVEA